MTDPIAPIDEIDILAAELALSLLDGAEAAVAMQREWDDPAFAARVAIWRERAAGWVTELPPEPVSEKMLAKLLAVIDEPNASSADAEPSRRGAGWRILAIFATCASLALALTLAAILSSPESRRNAPVDQTKLIAARDYRPNIAQIKDAKGAALLSAAFYPATEKMLVRTAALQSRETAPELWVLDSAGKPYSLGLIDRDGVVTLRLSPQLRKLLVDKAIIAITIEPREGAPHAVPSTAIVGTANLTSL